VIVARPTVFVTAVRTVFVGVMMVVMMMQCVVAPVHGRLRFFQPSRLNNSPACR
jgi:hypothetical protein